MIATAVLCPQPPLLFRELGGLADPVSDLRAACDAALRSALATQPDVVVVAGAVDDPASVDPARPVDVRRWGTAGERTGPPGLPLSLGVGVRLLDEAGWTGRTELLGLELDADRDELVAHAAALADRPERLVLLVLADGSARRDATGPGSLDERAFAFDAGVAAALRGGNAEALRGLDVALADELMVLGRPGFGLLGEVGSLAGPPRTAEVGYEGDPFGVEYLVATWAW